MDWFLDTGDPMAASALRRQIGDHLHRHATDHAAADDAELVLEELLGNAVRHTDGPAWVSLDWSDVHPVLRISDLGADFDLRTDLPDDELSEHGRGLFIVAHLTRALQRAHRRAGGNVLSATLDVERAAEVSYAPPRHTVGALPALEEAGLEGFGKEPFLRALVVQLALALEAQHGADAAEAALAQVGTDVGAQMEAEYRAAKRIVDRLDPRRLADCYVRLKHAIDGDFYVIEATDERIVLGNRACPFGAIVQRSPALCRMTSSVFGGIAARNADGASVYLEERIALGDPECRVVVTLGSAVPAHPASHRYPAPVTA